MFSSLKPILVMILLSLWVEAPVLAATPAPEGASVYIISPQNGAVISNPVTVRFGLRGMGVAPAGIDKAKTGHHHLLIDVMKLPQLDRPLPSDDRHRHFGGGQTEVELNLKPGEHRLQLILGDKDHIPFTPPLMSKPITIKVK